MVFVPLNRRNKKIINNFNLKKSDNASGKFLWVRDELGVGTKDQRSHYFN